MTKILKSTEYIKEAAMFISRTETNLLDLDTVSVDCKWDGEHWYYFDREHKGTLEDFKVLDKNKNTNFEMYLKFYFDINKKTDYEDEELDSCIVEMLVNLHWSDMSNDDYDIDVKYTKKMKEFVTMLEDYNVNDDTLREVVSDSWDEGANAGSDIADELDDKLGIDQYNKILDEIKDAAVSAFMDEYQKEKDRF